MLQSLNDLHGPSLDSFQYVSLALRSLELDPALQARPHQCWLMFNLVSTRTARSFSDKLLPSWATPSIILVHRVVPPQVQDFELLAELHEVPVSPLLAVKTS